VRLTEPTLLAPLLRRASRKSCVLL